MQEIRTAVKARMEATEVKKNEDHKLTIVPNPSSDIGNGTDSGGNSKGEQVSAT